MRAGKIGKQLKREIAANPKKAVFLGVIAVVAIYSWFPLIRGWISKQNVTATESGVVTATSPLTNEPAPASSTSTASAEKPPSWQELVEWMRNDPRTMIAPPLAQSRDPFASPTVETPAPLAAEKPEVAPPAVTPAAAGLVLTSTIIGPQRRVVQISGKMYSVGQTIDTAKEKEGACVTFKLVEVHPRRAVLQNGDERYELTIPEPGASQKIEVGRY